MSAGHSLIRGAFARRLGALPAALMAVGLVRAPALGCSPHLPSDVPLATAPAPADASPPPRSDELADASASDAPLDDAAEGGNDAATNDGALEASPAPAAEALVVLEKPYLTWARPRPKGDVAAGAHDELLARWNLGGTGSPDFPSNRPSYHPGTRVKVDTHVVSGRLPKTAAVDRRTGKRAVVLSETSLLARARKLGYWPYRLCFERAVQQQGKLKGGETWLRFAVERSGRIGPPRVLRSKLEAPDVVTCLVDKTRDIELLPPPRRLEVELAVQVWPGDAPLPSLVAPPTDPALQVPLDAAALAAAVQPERSGFAACYSAGLARDPGLWGRIQVHVETEPGGAIKAAKESESRFPDREVARCVLTQIKNIRLPRRAALPLGFEIAVRLGREPERPAAATP